MKYFLISILFFSLLNCQNSRTIQNNLKHSGNILFDKSITDILFNTIREYPNKSEFALALFVGDTTEYYGIKKEQSSVFTISNESSIFEIGSISKVFLTSLLVQTLKDSLIQLDSKLSSFLPFEISSYGYDNHEVKAIHLANHTSGISALPEGLIRDYQYDEQDDDELSIVKNYLKKNAKFKWLPGKKYEYSNLGMALLGLSICNIYNSSFESLIKKYITGPLVMDNTCVHLSAAQKKELVIGLDQFGKKSPMLVSELYASTGSLKSNVNDMVKFVKANMDDNYIYSSAHRSTFEQDEIYGVGLGWSYSNRNNSRVYFHHGGTVGYCSGIAFDKKNKIGIVVLTNRSALLKSVPDITEFMYKIFGDTYYKYRVQGT